MSLHPIFQNILAAHGLEGRVGALEADVAEDVAAECRPEAGRSPAATKHTPGPWIWADDYRGLYGAGPDNAILMYADYEGMWLPDYEARGKANAQLIAAAPDLLAALQWIKTIADANYEHDETLRSKGARTLKRISDKADAALKLAGAL